MDPKSTADKNPTRAFGPPDPRMLWLMGFPKMVLRKSPGRLVLSWAAEPLNTSKNTSENTSKGEQLTKS